MVAAGRPMAADPGASLRAHLIADPLAHLLRPGPLSEDACKALVEQVLQREPEDAFSEACHAESRGNPLWVREMARAVAAEGLPPTAANVHRLRELGREAVRRAVSLRLTRLPADAAAIARAVAILGDRTELGLAAALAERDEHDAYEAVRARRVRPRALAPGAQLRPSRRARRRGSRDQPDGERSRPPPRRLPAGGRRQDPEPVAMHVLRSGPARTAPWWTCCARRGCRARARGHGKQRGLPHAGAAGAASPCGSRRSADRARSGGEPRQWSRRGRASGRGTRAGARARAAGRDRPDARPDPVLPLAARGGEAGVRTRARRAAGGDSPLRRVLEAAACHAGLSVGMPLAQAADVAREHARATSPIPPTSADAGSTPSWRTRTRTRAWRPNRPQGGRSGRPQTACSSSRTTAAERWRSPRSWSCTPIAT